MSEADPGERLPPEPMDDWGRFLRLRGFGNADVWFRPQRLAERHARIELLSEGEARRVLERALHEGDQRQAIELLHRRAFGPPADLDRDGRWRRIEADLRDALRGGALVAHRLRSEPTPRGEQPVEPEPELPPGGDRPVSTWIAVTLVDEDEAPQPDVKVRVTRPGGSITEGRLDQRGTFRLDPVEAGLCDVTFPEIEGREWGPGGPSDEGDLRAAAPSAWVVAKPHDCVSSIAKDHGFGRTAPIVDAPENAPLWTERPNPNVLQKGDTVYVPERLERIEVAATGSEHRYRRASWTTRLRLRIEEAQQGDVCRIGAGTSTQTVTLKSRNGLAFLDTHVPANARSAEIDVPSRGLAMKLWLGALDPVETTRGQQQRLQNLGYPIPRVTGEREPHTVRSIRLFQLDSGITVDGVAGPTTQRRLLAAHGS